MARRLRGALGQNRQQLIQNSPEQTVENNQSDNSVEQVEQIEEQAVLGDLEQDIESLQKEIESLKVEKGGLEETMNVLMEEKAEMQEKLREVARKNIELQQKLAEQLQAVSKSTIEEKPHVFSHAEILAILEKSREHTAEKFELLEKISMLELLLIQNNIPLPFIKNENVDNSNSSAWEKATPAMSSPPNFGLSSSLSDFEEIQHESTVLTTDSSAKVPVPKSNTLK